MEEDSGKRMVEDSPDEKLPHAGAPQQRRVEVDVELTGLDLALGLFDQGRLMQAHAVREMRLEQVVVASGHLGDRGRQHAPVGVVEVDQRPLVRLGQDHRLKRPGRPPGAQGYELLVLVDHALIGFGAFQRGVVHQEVALRAVLFVVGYQLGQLQSRFFRQTRCRPDLAVRMRV